MREIPEGLLVTSRAARTSGVRCKCLYGIANAAYSPSRGAAVDEAKHTRLKHIAAIAICALVVSAPGAMDTYLDTIGPDRGHAHCRIGRVAIGNLSKLLHRTVLRSVCT